MANLDIIIVNWNSGEQLYECMRSLEVSNFSTNIIHEVIIVDNASNDGSLDKLQEIDLGIRIIRNKENKGFGAACNQGVKASVAAYLLFLNPDAIVYNNTISKTIDFMLKAENNKIGILGIQLIDNEGNISQTCTRFPNIKDFFVKMLGLSRIFPKKFPDFFMTEWDHKTNREVDHVIGAFYLIRRSLFERLEGFDERFFVYLEDLDLSYRAHKLGWKIYYLADVQAYHKGGGTSEQVKARRLFYSLHSRIQYGYKHFCFLSAVSLMLGTLSFEMIARLMLAVCHGSIREVHETIEGYVLLYRSIPNLLQENFR